MEAYLPLITGFAGVLVGSIFPLVGQFLQLRATQRRERMAWVLEAAKISHATSVDHAKSHQGATLPIASDIDYYQRVFDIIECGKDIPTRLKEAGEKNRELRTAFHDPL